MAFDRRLTLLAVAAALALLVTLLPTAAAEARVAADSCQSAAFTSGTAAGTVARAKHRRAAKRRACARRPVARRKSPARKKKKAPGAPSPPVRPDGPSQPTSGTPAPVPQGPVAEPVGPELEAQVPAGSGRAVKVVGTEWALDLSRQSVLAGMVTVEYNLVGAEDPHSLVAVREDGSGPVLRFDEQAPESIETKRFTFTAGRWLLVCDLTGHGAKGMRTELLVR